ncbi:MAG: hypothetical protein LBE09_04110, partial [Christensenellaceae bacterium]|nr:hypothetical protein [Christensenellaceae bacterium]
MLKTLVNKSDLITRLRKDLTNNNISHAYLLLGEDLETRAVASNIMSKILMCPDGGYDDCVICKKIDTNSSIDLKILNKDKKADVEDIKDMIKESVKMPWESAHRLFLINSADQLRVDQQNKILKLLEEPPSKVILILMAADESGLPQTITSRTQKLYLPRFSTQEIISELLEAGIKR